MKKVIALLVTLALAAPTVVLADDAMQGMDSSAGQSMQQDHHAAAPAKSKKKHKKHHKKHHHKHHKKAADSKNMTDHADTMTDTSNAAPSAPASN